MAENPIYYMSKRALAALEGSIQKWERVVATGAFGVGPEGCMLCQLYNHHVTRKNHRDACSPVCPVRADTGSNFCAGSPYEYYESAWDDYPADCKAAAVAERDYLKMLRYRAVVKSRPTKA